TAATPPALHAKLNLRDVDLKQAVSSEAGINSIKGHFDADASLAARGRSPAELIAGLSGEATLRGHDGTVSGIDLAAATEWLKVLDRPSDLFALIRSGLGGQTSFKELTGSFHAADGIVRSDDLRLAADGTAGQGTATLDLPRWTIASRLEFRLTGLPMAPPLRVQLEGPIDAPRERFDVNPLQHFLQQRQHVDDQPVKSSAPER
ncbi:MAG TPA: AsmA-like C-terminal region-containing protein, partial [Stellaceae bacterium]|nr:AsmA-like C-terminal region-containing protein [Stellaceae bacterium]